MEEIFAMLNGQNGLRQREERRTSMIINRTVLASDGLLTAAVAVNSALIAAAIWTSLPQGHLATGVAFITTSILILPQAVFA